MYGIYKEVQKEPLSQIVRKQINIFRQRILGSISKKRASAWIESHEFGSHKGSELSLWELEALIQSLCSEVPNGLHKSAFSSEERANFNQLFNTAKSKNYCLEFLST